LFSSVWRKRTRNQVVDAIGALAAQDRDRCATARLLRKVMKAAAGTSRLDELRTARIHHAPARVEGIVRRGGQIFNFRTLSDGKSWSGRSLQTRVVERGGVAD
jgi:hypothetical protein